MEADDLLAKLEQIEEQTNHLMAEPKTLTRERLLMILALSRQIRSLLHRSGSHPQSSSDDATILV